MEILIGLVVGTAALGFLLWVVHAVTRPKEDSFKTRPWETYRAPTTRQNRVYHQGAPSPSRPVNDPHTYDSSMSNPLNPLSPLYPYVPSYDSTPSGTHHTTHHDLHTPSHDYGGSSDGSYDGGSSSSCDTGSSDSGGGGSDGGGGCD